VLLAFSGALVACGSGESSPSNVADGSITPDAEDMADGAVVPDSAADAGRAADAGSGAGAALDAGPSSACTSTPVWDPTAVPSCTTLPPGLARMHVRGTLAGQSVDIQVETSGGYAYGTYGGNFEAPYLGQPTTDLDVDMNWSSTILHPAGAPFAATGTIRMRPADPLGGMTLCAGTGTQADFEWAAGDAGSEDYHFHLACLTLGPDCKQPVSGQIWGCWNNGN
jgi:hypothetical protein